MWKPHTAEMAELLVDAGVRLVSATWDSAVGYFEQVVQPELEQVGADGAFMYPGISATDTAGTLKRWGVGIPTQMARKIARTMLWRVRTTAALEAGAGRPRRRRGGAGAGAGAGGDWRRANGLVVTQHVLKRTRQGLLRDPGQLVRLHPLVDRSPTSGAARRARTACWRAASWPC